MAAGIFNEFIIEKGATFAEVLEYTDGLGVGIDLTSYTLRGKIKRRVSDASALVSFSFTLANQGTYPGRFTISLTATQTSSLPWGQNVYGQQEDILLPYDIEAVLGSQVDRILQGTINLNSEVTT